MTRCTDACSEFMCCPLAPFRAVAESAEDSRMAKDGAINVPWYLVIGWTVLAAVYVTYQLIYLLPDLKAWIGVAS